MNRLDRMKHNARRFWAWLCRVGPWVAWGLVALLTLGHVRARRKTPTERSFERARETRDQAKAVTPTLIKLANDEHAKAKEHLARAQAEEARAAKLAREAPHMTDARKLETFERFRKRAPKPGPLLVLLASLAGAGDASAQVETDCTTRTDDHACYTLHPRTGLKGMWLSTETYDGALAALVQLEPLQRELEELKAVAARFEREGIILRADHEVLKASLEGVRDELEQSKARERKARAAERKSLEDAARYKRQRWRWGGGGTLFGVALCVALAVGL